MAFARNYFAHRSLYCAIGQHIFWLGIDVQITSRRRQQVRVQRTLAKLERGKRPPAWSKMSPLPDRFSATLPPPPPPPPSGTKNTKQRQDNRVPALISDHCFSAVTITLAVSRDVEKNAKTRNSKLLENIGNGCDDGHKKKNFSKKQIRNTPLSQKKRSKHKWAPETIPQNKSKSRKKISPEQKQARKTQP